MTETYTQTVSSREVDRHLDSDVIRLDADDQLFYDMLKSELDALLRQPHSEIISKITSYSQTRRAPLI
ncbi:hypothetical protein [Parapedobacter sp. 10938]|uniref:hypothetical protein n=1 Tax=Parapedobacter flavus TaxID=3110225 RepID=UPI002DBAAD00|nr:hypothetical protein [Parapedobacter sp. 10938]MEC3880768.1 hypothetical protein [Parapedobacter sp. 10938]